MRKCFLFLITVVFLLVSGCREDHLINNKNYRRNVESAFAERQLSASNRREQLFSVFNGKLNIQQIEALKFLFAYMPLSDLVRGLKTEGTTLLNMIIIRRLQILRRSSLLLLVII
jgi:hypothetical protein